MARLRRILLTGDAARGVWRYGLELARGLAERGVQPVLALLGQSPDAERLREARQIPGLRVIVTGLPTEASLTNEGELREAGAALAGLALRVRADSVHLHTPALAAEVPWAMPVVVTTHSDIGTWWGAVHREPLPAEIAWRIAAVGRGLAEADAVIAPSRSYAQALARLYRPGRPISVVHKGCTPLSLPPLPRCQAVLTAGRLWDEGENIALLDRAAANLDAPVLAAGPVAGPNGAMAELAHLSTLGPLAEPALAAAMAQASVFVAPARYAPFGLPVLEAAQAGMALALADIPGFRELWGGVALFFHPEDPAGLGDALNRLLAHPAAPGARARRHASRYNPDGMVEGTLAIHRQVVESRPA